MHRENLSPVAFLIVGLVIGIVFIRFLLRYKKINVSRIDESTLLLKLPLLGIIEVEESRKYQGMFVKCVSETFDKIKFFNRLMDFQTMLKYAKDYNVNYIGTEGNMEGKWGKGKLAYNTLSKGKGGGYNVYLNPNLDRESVSRNLSKELGIEIKPHELYTFLFLHEIGHTAKAGNESYIAAQINHRLGSRKRRRWKDMELLHKKIEKFADDFAIQELLKLRKESGG